MREIKFRAWDKKTKTMWAVEDLSWCDPCFIVANPGLEHMDIQDRDCRNKRVPMDIRLMQYTGLKDKNGVEIYEGDIVKNQALVDSVIVTEGVTTLTRSGYDKFFVKQPLAVHDGLEVIGNIFENPELLEAGNDQVLP